MRLNIVRDIFLKILKEYKKARGESFANNSTAIYIRDSGKLINKLPIINNERYKVEGSPGKGQWAFVPWIAIFDKNITESATKGYYIVYLFCADMKGVYLSLNQGYNFFEKKYKRKGAIEILSRNSSIWKSLFSPFVTSFEFDEIDLKTFKSFKKNHLMKAYEVGHICGKFYSIDNMPKDEDLIDDLRKMLKFYEIFSLIITSGNHSVFFSSEYLESINSLIIDDCQSNKLDLVQLPKSFSIKKEQETEKYGPLKIDFKKYEETRKEIGLLGEMMVIEYEKERLKKEKRDDLAKKVKHVSLEEGDGLGYDILSYDAETGDKKYIEVKTTRGNINTPFYITKNEIQFSKDYLNNYYLYRLHEFDSKGRKAKVYVFKGDLEDELDFTAINYMASLRCNGQNGE